MTAEITLRCGKKTLVDADMVERLSGFSWRYEPSRNTGYVVFTRKERGVARTYRMHRIIMDAPGHLFVDHINGDGLDNRRANLRLCSHQENTRNRRYGRTTTGFKGVVREGERFRAHIMIDGKQVSLGGFATAIEAAVAYDEAAREHFGEFARPNFSPDRDWILPKPNGRRMPQCGPKREAA